MDILTGIPDLDMMILMNLDDHELDSVVKVNRYLKSLCEGSVFLYKRIIRKIQDSRSENLKCLKNLRINEIEGKRLDSMKDFFGLETLQELNNFLNEIPKKGLYTLYHIYPETDGTIKQLYTFDEKQLPKYISKKELIFHLRREFTKEYFRNVKGNRIDIPTLYLSSNTPGYVQLFSHITLSTKAYERNKILGIRK